MVGVVSLAGFLYFQFSDVFQAGSETIGQVFTIIEEFEDIEDLENLNEIDKLEDLEEIENIGEIEVLENLESEDLEQIKEVIPVLQNIYDYLPQGIIDMFQENQENIVEKEPEAPVEEEMAKSEEELLPDSVEIHPDMNFVDYQDFEGIPEMIWERVEEEYINKETVLLIYETDFAKKEIAELKELEEVPEDIADEMIEEQKEELTELYNIYEIANWHEEKLLTEGWEMRGEGKKLDDKLFYQHDQEGYFIIIPPERFIYTPLK